MVARHFSNSRTGHHLMLFERSLVPPGSPRAPNGFLRTVVVDGVAVPVEEGGFREEDGAWRWENDGIRSFYFNWEEFPVQLMSHVEPKPGAEPLPVEEMVRVIESLE